ncbi:MAG: Ig-like domain-containing protein [Ruminococcus sp.]|nr:Ig-like domain-containing protein [Ruminococcus sp.]
MKKLKSISIILLSIAICTLSVSPYFAAKAPKAPKTLKLSNTANGIKASWSKVKGATKYVLKYKKSTAKKYKIAYSGKKIKYTDDNLSPGATYKFKVKAVVKKKSSAYTKPATIVYLDKPQLSAEELLDMNGITLTWSKVKGAKGYRIYRSLKSQNSYKKIATIKSGSTKTYLDKTVKDSKTPTRINSYKYYIKAYNGNYSSAKSNIASEIFGYFEDEDTPLYLTIKKGETYKDIYNKLSSYYATGLVTWKTSDKSIAKVSSVGVITGVKKGTATLTASVLYNDKVHDIKIIVTVK